MFRSNFSRWVRKTFSSTNRAKRRGKQQRKFDFLPKLETFEDRVVPATLFVTDGGDSGLATQLRFALTSATPGSSIDIEVPVITLTSSIALGNNDSNLTLVNDTVAMTASPTVTIEGPTVTNSLFTVAANTTAGLTGGNTNPVLPGGITIYGGRNTDLNSGGGAFNNFGTLTLSNLTFTGNTATGSGGAIFSEGKLNVLYSTFSGDNQAQGDGGAIFNHGGTGGTSGTATVSGCLFADNVGAAGGAIFTAAGKMTIINSTFSQNQAVALHQGSGGAIYNSGSLQAIDNTIVNNSSKFNFGGGIFTFAASPLTTTVLDGNIIAGNTGTSGGDDINGGNGGVVTAGSYNLYGFDGTGSINNSGVNTGNLDEGANAVADAGLEPLNFYGGPTETFALLPDSQAVENPGYVNASIINDQRGLGRTNVLNIFSNIGAYQRNSLVVNTSVDTNVTNPNVTPAVTLNESVPVGYISLRDAINVVDADTDVAGGAQPITFNDPYIITINPTIVTVGTNATATGTFLLGPVGVPGPIAKIFIQGDKDITVSGGGNVGVFLIDPSNVLLAGLVIEDGKAATNGGGIDNQGGTLAVTSCSINDNEAPNGDGGGIYSSKGNVTITSTTGLNTFASNSAGVSGGGVYTKSGTFAASGSNLFELNTAGDNGGGIFSNSGSLVISGTSTFNTNTAGKNGGGIYSDGLKINGSTLFTTNHASTVDGGGIYNDGSLTLNNINFQSNSADVSGGGIYNTGGAITVNGTSTFNLNTATTGSGGGIINDGLVTFNNSTTFTANTADVNGGGIDSEGLSITGGATFTTDQATTGSGGGIDNDGTLTIGTTGANTVTFTSDSADVSGGGISNTGGTVTVNGTSTFHLNTATTGSGGGIINDGLVKFKNSATFTNNTADLNGGGIDSDGLSIAGDATFTSNSASAGSGGGIYNNGALTLGSSSSTTIDFTSNTANGSGGGIYSVGGAVTIEGTSIFHLNTASTGSGGGIFTTSSLKFKGDTTFTLNTAGLSGGGIDSDGLSIKDGQATFTGNSASAGSGGGIRNNGALSLGSSSSSTINFTSNSASGNGGGIYNTGGTVTIDGTSTFHLNTASNGGGIDSNGLSIEGEATFSNNSATAGNGGAINNDGALSLGSSSSSTIRFTSNTATGDGGGIYNVGGAVTINGTSIFSGNQATGVGSDGGAIFSDGSLTIGSASTFTTNKAGNDGGAIFIEDAKLSIESTSNFTGNTAGADGGGIYNSAGSVSISGSTATFKNNSAAQNGGGIYSFDGTVTISDNTVIFKNNAATNDDGGAIWTNAGLTISGITTTFESNTAAGGDGGAIFSEGNITIGGNTSTNDFTGNTAGSSGGAIWNSEAGGLVKLAGRDVFTENTATNDSGGAIYTSGGTLTITTGSSLFDGNVAGASGGAIHDGGALNLKNGEFDSNTAAFSGGGIYVRGAATLIDTTLNSNTATNDQGGGIAEVGGSLTITNSTVYGNSGFFGGGIYFFDSLNDSILTATDITVTQNDGVVGGGIYTVTNGTTYLNGDLVVGNTPSDIDGNGATISLTSSDNLIGIDNTGALQHGINNQVGVTTTEAGLGALGFYDGGLTETIKLQPGSFAIGKGLVANQTAGDGMVNPAVDQNGFGRPLSGGQQGDVGAFQFSALPVVSPITVTGVPFDITSPLPASPTFTVTATDIFAGGTQSGSLTYQWDISTDGGNTFVPLSIGSGLYGASVALPTLTVNNADITPSMNGVEYDVVVTNTATGEMATTTPATLIVNYAPSITVQPASTTVANGDTATFTAAATGYYNSPDLSVQWMVSTDQGATWNDVPGTAIITNTSTNPPGISTTTSVLTIPGAADSMNQYEYEAVFTDTLGMETTNAATLTVNSVPTVFGDPGDQIVTAPTNTATFTAEALGYYGSPTATAPNMGVTWLVSTDGGVSFKTLSGASISNTSAFTSGTSGTMTTTSTLTITNATAGMNQFEYEAVFTDALGSVTSTAGTLTVDAAPVVTIQPTSTTVTAGGNATFTAAATGFPAPAVQWEVSTDGGGTWNDISGAEYGVATTSTNPPGITTTTSVLTITDVMSGMNQYEYEAVFTNGSGTATTNQPPVPAAILSVGSTGSLAVNGNPASITVNAPTNTAPFTASAIGSSAASVVWLVSTDGGGSYTTLFPGTSTGVSTSSSTSGGVTTTTSTLTLTNATALMNGNEYEAQFTNSFGSVTTTPATLTVDFPATITSNLGASPVPVSNNSTVTINAGATEMFTATASGNPAPTVTWEVSTTGAPGTYSAVTLGSTYSVTTTNPTATSTTSTLVITNAPITLNDDFYEAVFQNTLSGSPVPPPSTATTSPPVELMVDAVPAITGTLLNQTVSDNATINPFSGVVLTGTDNPGETQNITVILSGTQGGTTPIVTNGTLTPGAGGSYLNGVFTDDGVTLAQAQADLRALVFTPTDHQVVPGSTVTTFFTLEVATFSNSNPPTQVGSTVTNSGTSVIATAIASPTVITGTVAGQTVNDGATIQPFSSVVLANPDNPSETHTINVVLSGANGTLSNLSGGTFANDIYTLTNATIEQAQTDLRALVFTPTTMQVALGHSITTTFILTINDGSAGTATDNSTTVVAANTLLNEGLVITIGSNVNIYATSGVLIDTIAPFGNSVSSVQAVTGDVINGDPALVVASGPGGGQVETIDGITGATTTFSPYGPSYTKGLHIGVGNVLDNVSTDVNIVVGPGGVGQPVKIFNNTGTLEASFAPFPKAFVNESYVGGIVLAVGNLNGSGKDEIAVGTVYPENGLVATWNFNGTGFAQAGATIAFSGKGVFLSTGMFSPSTQADLVVGTGLNSAPHASIDVINAVTEKIVAGLPSAELPVFSNGANEPVRVGVLDVSGNGTMNVVAATGMGPTQQVRVFDLIGDLWTLEETLTAAELDLPPGYNSGIFVG